ncbi:MAG: hypothetical protein ACI4TK_10590, partial [Agathobacter sp.]
MLKLFLIAVWVFAMAHIAASRYKMQPNGISKSLNLPNILLMLPMIGLLGLRTSYNDTGAYITSFQDAVKLSEFFSDPENYDLLSN